MKLPQTFTITAKIKPVTDSCRPQQTWKKAWRLKKGQNKDSYSLNKSVTTELIKLQERQTELSAAIAYQQRINTLLV